MMRLIKILAVCLILGGAYFFNRSGLFQKALGWIDSLGVWGPFFFVLAYILTAVFFVPSFVFTFAAGVLFGLGQGILYSLAGTGGGALAAFLIGRHLARPWVSAYFSRRTEFLRMDEAIRRKGWKIILLARLSPVFPFLVGNYAFGLTGIRAWQYFVASVLGTVPSAAVYVYMGTLAGSIAAMSMQDRARTPAEWLLLGGGFIATALLVYYVRKIAGSAIRSDLENPSGD